MKTKAQLFIFFISFLSLNICTTLWANEDQLFFEQHIRPVLVEHCYKCHSVKSGKSKGGLFVDSRQALLKGGDTGPAIVPGQVEKSLLIEAIRYDNRDLQMPEKKQLPASIVEKFEKWVKTGAYDPRTETTKIVKKDRMKDGRREYWSFQAIKNYNVPKTQNTSWSKTDYDAFILKDLESLNLLPNPSATPSSLLRRLSLDLIGLPTNQEKNHRIHNKGQEGSYEKIVDEYLASSQFGIKWSRFWLDMARYSETAGGGRSYPIPSAWRYRNYVIDAFNQDMPYDQFLKEQIAGDLLPAHSESSKTRLTIATGFMVLGAKPLDLPNKENLNYDHIDEQLDNLGKVTMGMTFGCARCHDHRFDPVTEKDYYRMAAILDNTKGLQHLLISRFNDVPLPGAEKDTIKVATANTEKFRNLLKSISVENKKLAAQSLNTTKQKILLQKKLDDLVQEDSQMLKALALNEKKSMKQGYVRLRGQASRLGAKVTRSAPIDLIPQFQPEKVPESQSGRIELANWIANSKNPLTSRVIVNRVWAQLMGKGLVESLDNFGTTGHQPSHPELLDYLALDFIENGWSLKYLIKKIVMSSVYQMSTALNDQKERDINLKDPENTYLSFYPQRRMSAEMIRDSILYISGQLDNSITNGVLPYAELQNSVKRSVFLPSLREEGRNHLLDVFDLPDAAASMGKRNLTNLPSQALYLKNSSFIHEQSKNTAIKLLSKTEGHTTAQRLKTIYKNIYGHSIPNKEFQVYMNYLENEPQKMNAWTMITHTMLCSVNFRFFN